MTSFAQLGIKITSEGVNETKAALDSLVNSAKIAQAATDNLTQSNLKAEKSNKNATNSYYDMVAKLSQSKSVYESLQMALKGYTDNQIRHINALKSSIEAEKTTKAYQDEHNKTIQRSSELYADIVNKLKMTDAEYRNSQLALKGLTSAQIAHINALESEKRAASEAASAQQRLASERRAAQSSFISNMSAGTQVNPYSNVISGGMSQSGAAALQAQARAAEEAARSQSNLGQSAQSSGTHFNELNRILAKTHDMLIRMAAYRAISIIGSLPGDILDVNMRMETLRVQLEGITGSAKDGMAVFDKMVKLDFKTPFDIEGLTKTWVMFKNFGLDPTEKVMSALTNSVARLGGGTEQLIGIGRQLGQAWSKDKLQLVDMKPMIERGLPVLNLLSERLKVSTGDILDMSKAGTLNRDVMMLLIDEMEKWGKGQALRQMDTMKGALSNITSGWMQLQDAFLTDKGGKNVASLFKTIGDTLFFLRDNINGVILVFELLAGLLAVKLVASLMASVVANRAASVAATENAVASLMLSQNISKVAAAELLRTSATAAGTSSATLATTAMRGLNVAMAAYATYVIGNAIVDHFDEVKISIIAAGTALEKFALTRKYIDESRKVSGDEQVKLTEKYYKELESLDSVGFGATRSILNRDKEIEDAKAISEATNKQAKDTAELNAAMDESSNISKVALDAKLKGLELSSSYQKTINDQALNDNARLHEQLKITDEKYISNKISLSKSMQDYNNNVLQDQQNQVKDALEKEIKAEKSAYEQRKLIQSEAEKIPGYIPEKKVGEFQLGDKGIKLQEQLDEINNKIKTNTITNAEELNKINDESLKLREENNKKSLDNILSDIDSAAKAEQNITKENISKIDYLYATRQISERKHLDAINAAQESSFEKQKKYIEDKIALAEQEKSSLGSDESSKLLPIDNNKVAILESYTKALADNTVKKTANRVEFELSSKGMSGKIDLAIYEIESLQKQANATDNLSESSKRGLELDKQVRALREQLDSLLTQHNDNKNKYAANSYKLSTQEKDQLEQEKIKYLELTGQIEKAIEAKSKLALKNNVPYQDAVKSSDKPTDPNYNPKGNTYEQLVLANASLEKQIALRQEAINYRNTLESIQESTKNLGVTSSETFDIINGGFGNLIVAFSNLTKETNSAGDALRKNSKAQADVLSDPRLSDKKKTELSIELKKKEAKLDKESTLASINGYRQIAGAASKMFAEKSTAAKALHAIEVGLSVASMAMKAAEIAMELKSTVVSVAAGAAKFFAQSGWVGFAGVAAMMAVLGGLGYAASSSDSISVPVPESPDTGTVLGDTTAKSESINNTYELLKDIHAEEYAELRGINQGVASLSSGITNVITRLFQASGLADYTGKTGKEYNLKPITMIDPVSKWLAGFLVGGLFGTTTKKVTGSGIATGATSIADIMAGGNLAAQQYTTIQTTKKSWFSKKVSYKDVFSDLDANTQKAMNDVFKSMGDTMISVAEQLGHDTKGKIEAYIIPAMKIDLTGLSGEDAAKKLNNVISTALDTMATSVFGDILGQYQQLGEGMLETAVRIVAEVAVVKDALSTSGLSLAANAIAISDSIVKAAGGLKEFQKAFESYIDKFYTDNEKLSRSYNSLSNSLLGVLSVLPDSRKGYRNLIESIDISTIKGQLLYATLIKLSSAADSYYTSLEENDKKFIDDIANAKDKLASSYKTESDAITTTINKMSGFIDSLKKFRDGLVIGSMSASNATQKYNDTLIKFNESNKTINNGYGTTDASKSAFTEAIDSLPTNSNNFLIASMVTSKTSLDYARDYSKVLFAIQNGIDKSGETKTIAEKQLDDLDKSVMGLIDIKIAVNDVNASIAGVTEAISGLAKNEAEKLAIQKKAEESVNAATIKRMKEEEEAARIAHLRAAYNKASAITESSYLGALYDANSAGYFKNPAKYHDTYANEWSRVAKEVLGSFDSTKTVEQWDQVRTILTNLVQWDIAQMQGRGGVMPNFGVQAAQVLNGSHSNGLDYVPFDGYIAELHKGERVLTADNNERLFMNMSNPNSNKSSDEEIKLLRQEMARLQISNAEIARTNKKIADILVNVTMDGQSVLTTPA